MIMENISTHPKNVKENVRSENKQMKKKDYNHNYYQ